MVNSGKPDLVVSLDSSLEKIGVENVVHCAKSLENLDLWVKIGPFLRANGNSAIAMFHRMGFRVFADHKLTDIPSTLETDAFFLNRVKPERVTVMCSSGMTALTSLRNKLDPSIELLGVTVPTSFTDRDCRVTYNGRSWQETVHNFILHAWNARLNGVVLSVSGLSMLKGFPASQLTAHCPGIRLDEKETIANDDQAGRATIAEAIRAGANAVIIGRPITSAPDPREAAQKALEIIGHEYDKLGSSS